jgi:hypothetical protein
MGAAPTHLRTIARAVSAHRTIAGWRPEGREFVLATEEGDVEILVQNDKDASRRGDVLASALTPGTGHHERGQRTMRAAAKAILVERIGAAMALGHPEGRALLAHVMDKVPVRLSYEGRFGAIRHDPQFRHAESADGLLKLRRAGDRIVVQRNLPGGYRFNERTITIDQSVQVPETVVQAMLGEPFRRIVDLPELEHCTAVVESIVRPGPRSLMIAAAKDLVTHERATAGIPPLAA